MKEGKVVVGVMGCPNLPVDPKLPEGEKGVIFVAVEGQGAFQVRSFHFSQIDFIFNLILFPLEHDDVRDHSHHQRSLLFL